MASESGIYPYKPNTIGALYGRLVLFVGSVEASIIPPKYVTKIFLCGDVLAFFLQAGGGGMMS